MGEYQMRYVSPDGGEVFDFFDPMSPIGVPGGRLSGMVSDVRREYQSALGVPGVLPGTETVDEMTGSLEVLITPLGGESMTGLYEQWVGAWDTYSFGQLVVERGGDSRTANVRLAEDMPGPEVVPEIATELRVTMPMECLDGVWWGPTLSGEGAVTVVNEGAVTVRPRVVWEGAGGAVVLPSGAIFTLPSVTGARVLYLDDAESNVVTHVDGRVDRAVWESMAGKVMPEGVPHGSSGTFVLPAGARLEWENAYTSAWR